MELKSQFKYSTIPATPESERIFSQKEHALIGISPFNGYYTEANLEKIFYWALNTFKNISVFIPTEISAYTLQAMEYEKEKAQKKTFRQDCLLKNKALRALEANKLSKTEAENKIVRLSDINAGEKYTKFYDKYVDLYDNDKDFRAGSLLTSKWVLETKGIFCDVEDEAVRAAVKYFLAELPLYLNTPEILNVSSSLFVYKDLPSPFLQNIYNDNLLVSPGQGYLTVKIECPTNNDAEDSMRKNSIYIKNILNQVSGSIYWKNRDGTYLGCNQKEAELVGLSSPEDLIGKTDYDLSWKHIADVLKKTDQRIMNTKISEEVIETPKLASGKEVVMLSRKSPLYDDEDNVIGIIGVSIDITAHKRAEELEAQRESQQKEIDLQNKIKNIFEKFVKNISFTLTELAVVIQNNKNLTEEEQIDITSKAIGIKSIINELQIALQENRLDRFTG